MKIKLLNVIFYKFSMEKSKQCLKSKTAGKKLKHKKKNPSTKKRMNSKAEIEKTKEIDKFKELKNLERSKQNAKPLRKYYKPFWSKAKVNEGLEKKELTKVILFIGIFFVYFVFYIFLFFRSFLLRTKI